MALVSFFTFLSVRACTVMPTLGSTYCGALPDSAPQRFCKRLLHPWLLNFGVDFCSYAFPSPAPSKCHPHRPFSDPSLFVIALRSMFYYLFNFTPMLVFFAVLSRTIFRVSWQHMAPCLSLCCVHTTSMWAVSFATFILSLKAASLSSLVTPTTFYTITLLWSASSCLSTSNFPLNNFVVGTSGMFLH